MMAAAGPRGKVAPPAAFNGLVMAAVPFMPRGLSGFSDAAGAEARVRLRAAVRAALQDRLDAEDAGGWWPEAPDRLLAEAAAVLLGARPHLTAGAISAALDSPWPDRACWRDEI